MTTMDARQKYSPNTRFFLGVWIRGLSYGTTCYEASLEMYAQCEKLNFWIFHVPESKIRLRGPPYYVVGGEEGNPD